MKLMEYYLTTKEAAAYLRISPRTIYQLTNQRRLIPYQTSRKTRYRFTAKQLDEFAQKKV
jgi:excisionase family DNA binding protein